MYLQSPETVTREMCCMQQTEADIWIYGCGCGWVLYSVVFRCVTQNDGITTLFANLCES